MTCALNISTHAPSDFHIVGPYPFTIGAIAAGDNLRVSAYVKLLGRDVFRGPVNLAKDYGVRIPGDHYLVRVQDVTPGVYYTTFLASANGQVATATASVRVFQKPDIVFKVYNTATLTTALNAIVTNGEYAHAKLILEAGSYSWPNDLANDLSASSTLISTESEPGQNVFITFTAAVKVKWGYWYGIQFSKASGTAFQAISGTTHALEKCSLMHSVTGLTAPDDAFIRMEDCHLNSLRSGIIGANIVRSLSWEFVDNSLFQDCDCVDGTIGSRLAVPENADQVGKAVSIFSFLRPRTSGVIRNNAVVGDYSVFIKAAKEIKNIVISGNSVTTSAERGIILSSISNSYIAYNSINHTGSLGTLNVDGDVGNNIVINNWFRNLTSTSRKLADSGRWEGNATLSSTGINAIQVDADPFQNNYLFLKESSTLRFIGVDDSSTMSVQGIKSTSQIGAFPHNADINLESLYTNILKDPDFAFSAPPVST